MFVLVLTHTDENGKQTRQVCQVADKQEYTAVSKEFQAEHPGQVAFELYTEERWKSLQEVSAQRVEQIRQTLVSAGLSEFLTPLGRRYGGFRAQLQADSSVLIRYALGAWTSVMLRGTRREIVARQVARMERVLSLAGFRVLMFSPLEGEAFELKVLPG